MINRYLEGVSFQWRSSSSSGCVPPEKHQNFILEGTTVLPAKIDSYVMLFTKLSGTYIRKITCVLILSAVIGLIHK